MPQPLGNLAVGAKVKHPDSKLFGQPVAWKIADKNHHGYPAYAVTLISEKILALRPFDARERSNTDSDRREYGNNRYLHSNLRQWLNSDAAAGQWYTAQHSADTPPSNSDVRNSENDYDTKAGFLNGFSTAFKAALIPTTLTVTRNTATDGGGSETVSDKIFLASRAEVGLATGGIEGELLPLFSGGDTSRTVRITAEGVSNNEYSYASATSDWTWWLRTPGGGSYYVYNVSMTGAAETNYAYNGIHGVRPLCNLSASSTLVSDAADASGYYTILSFNAPPSISGVDGSLGIKSEPFSFAYTVSDSVGDVVSVVETVGGAQIREYTPAPEESQSAEITGNAWLTLQNGPHTLTITATDSSNAVATRKMSFEKSVTSCGFALEPGNVLETFAVRPSRITVEVIREIAAGSALTVEVCNNAYDAEPTWEDASAAVISGLAHVFRNTVKTVLDWGVSIRVNLDRNGAVGNCRLYGVKGYIE